MESGGLSTGVSAEGRGRAERQVVLSSGDPRAPESHHFSVLLYLRASGPGEAEKMNI